jgi:DNA-directed RNA polymerase subunit M/transcription elongation factor TFIIS
MKKSTHKWSDARMHLDFCPTCGRRLVLRFRDGGALYCPKCNTRKEIPEDYFINDWHDDREPPDAAVVVLDNGTMQLQTLPTVETYCEKCGGRRAKTWSVAFGSESIGSITYYQCTSCDHTRRNIE